MNRQPLLIILGLFLILTLIFAGFIVSRKLTPSGLSGGEEEDAEVDETNLGNVTLATLWDMHKNIMTKNTLKIHLFQVDNPDQVLNGEKPVVREIGPYTYEQLKNRVTLGIYEENDSVRYKDHLMYHFRPDLSKGNESDIVTIINMPWVGLAQEVARLSWASRFIVMAIVNRYQESVFMTRPVHELLFGGFYHELISTFSGITGETYMPNNTFGFFYGRNDTFLPSREVNLGLSHHHKFGHTLKWKGQPEMEWWNKKDEWGDEVKDEKCNKFDTGSDWNMMHPGVKRSEELVVFADDLCRNIKLVYEKDVHIGGVEGYRFTIPKSEFEDPRTNPENLCYCTEPENDDYDGCPKDGVYQFNVCSKGASVLLSHPHFYDGHSSYLSNLHGVNPSLSHHQTYIDVEPVTGQVLKYSKKIQVNLHLKPLSSIADFRKVPDMTFPVIWTDETATLSEESLVELKAKLRKGVDHTVPSYKLNEVDHHQKHHKKASKHSEEEAVEEEVRLVEMIGSSSLLMGGVFLLPLGIAVVILIIIRIRVLRRSNKVRPAIITRSGKSNNFDHDGVEFSILGGKQDAVKTDDVV